MYGTKKQHETIESLSAERGFQNAKSAVEQILGPGKADNYLAIEELPVELAGKVITALIAMPRQNHPKATAALKALDEINEINPFNPNSAQASQTWTSYTVSAPVPTHALAPSHEKLIEIASKTAQAETTQFLKELILPNSPLAVSLSTYIKQDLEKNLNLQALTQNLKAELSAPLAAYVKKEVEAIWGNGATWVKEAKGPEPELPLNEPPQPTNANLIPRINPHFYLDPEAARAVRTAIKRSKHLFITGPAGCGKTEAPAQVAARMGRGILDVSMNGSASASTFIGNMDVVPHITEDGKTISVTKFTYGMLPRAMKEGLILILNEADATPPHICFALHSALSAQRQLYIPETGETIHAAKGFVVIATANSGGKGDGTGVYTGVEVLNEAFLDRFGLFFNMDYLPYDKELEMLQNRFPATTVNISKLLDIATEVRMAFKRQQIAISFSTRKIIDCLENIEEGYTTLEALALTLTNRLDDDDKGLVQTIIDRAQLDQITGTPIIQPSTSIRESEFYEFIRAQNKVYAIKALRDRHNIGLVEAKALVEAVVNGKHDAKYVWWTPNPQSLLP